MDWLNQPVNENYKLAAMLIILIGLFSYTSVQTNMERDEREGRIHLGIANLIHDQRVTLIKVKRLNEELKEYNASVKQVQIKK